MTPAINDAAIDVAIAEGGAMSTTPCEADPSIALPLLLGIARGTGRRSSAAEGATATSPLLSEEGRAELLRKDLANHHYRKSTTLPAKLHAILSSPALVRRGVASWNSHGRSFRIRDEVKFRDQVLNVYFADNCNAVAVGEGGDECSQQGTQGGNNDNDSNIKTMEGFYSALRSYGFNRSKGDDVRGEEGGVSYYHKDFLRGRPNEAGAIMSEVTTSSPTSSSTSDAATKESGGGDTGANDSKKEGGDARGGNDDEEEDAAEEDGDATKKGDVVVDPSSEIVNFMAFTGTSDVDNARHYLEMSGNHLETAISLFMDHGGGGSGMGVAGGLGVEGLLQQGGPRGAGVVGGSSGEGVGRGGARGGGDGDAVMEDVSEPKASSPSKQSKSSNNEDEKDEEEPDFDTLPPMPLLPFEERELEEREERERSPAERIVNSALREYRAHRTIRRALLRWMNERRRSPSVAGSGNNTDRDDQVVPARGRPRRYHRPSHRHHYGISHFLLRSTLHSSLLVRRTASRMILHNYHRALPRHARGRHSVEEGGLRDVLVILLHGLMFGEGAPYQLTYPTTASSSAGANYSAESILSADVSTVLPRLTNLAEGGDPAVQVASMLTSLVCHGGFPNMLVGEEVMKQLHQRNTSSTSSTGTGGMISKHHSAGNDEAILCGTLLRELSSRSIESFVASGGLRWACGAIVRLVHMLVHNPAASGGATLDVSAATRARSDCDGGGSSSDEHPTRWGDVLAAEQMEDDNAKAIQTRLLLLIDLVYRLVLFGTVPAAVDREAAFTTANPSGGRDGDDGRPGTPPLPKDGESGPVSRAARSRPSSSRTTAIQESLRNSIIGAPPLSSRATGGRGRGRTTGEDNLTAGRGWGRARGGDSSGGALGALVADGGGGGGGDGPSLNVNQENRQRKSRRKATLEKVHGVFWSSDLPAAVCVPKSEVPRADRLSHDSNQRQTQSYQTFSPLECLIAAHEILRAASQASSTASNIQIRGLEKGISLLARMVDPAGGHAVVVTSGEDDVPWVMTAMLRSGVATGCGSGGGRKRSASTGSRGSKKRSRTSSQDSSGKASPASNPRRADAPPARPSGASQPAHHRPSAGTSSNATSRSVSALLDRLTHVDASGAAGSSGPSSLFSSRHRSAMESMMRSSPAASASGSAAASRDGSLSRILAASLPPAPSSTGRIRLREPNSATSNSTAPSSSASPLSRLRAARASAPGVEEVDEWRVLDEQVERVDVMDVVNEGESDDFSMEEIPLNNNRGEGNNDHSDVDEDDDDSEASEVGFPAEGEDRQDGDNSNDEDNDDSHDGSVDEEVGDEEVEGANNSAGGDNAYNEDMDDDEEEYDIATGQFDDAVINLEDITAAAASSSHTASHSQGREAKNPHRHSVATPRGSGPRIGGGGSGEGSSPLELAMKKRDREERYLRAAMHVLATQYPDILADSMNTTRSWQEKGSRTANPYSIFAHPMVAPISMPLLTSNAESSLLKSLCNIIKPPRKPLNLKIFMRRAPTQEEFFRGSLSRNPIALSSLTMSSDGGDGGDRRNSSGGGSGSNTEPLVSDLRLHIAKDLQMEDSAELLELLVGNKILDMNLKLRVVQQVLWKKYVEENATSASSLVAGAGPSHQMISTGNGMSMIFSSSGLTGVRRTASDNAILASFPPMVVTYRLAGVDGEATEDKVEVDDLEDPEAPPSGSNVDKDAVERRMEKEFGMTRLITREDGVAVLLASVARTIDELLRRIRRDEVARLRRLRNNLASANDGEDGNTTREQFAKAPPCPGLLLLRHCANIADNRKKLLANRAPTSLLRILLDILNAMNRSSGEDHSPRSRNRKRSSTFDFGTSHSMDVDTAEEAGVANDGDESAQAHQPPASSRNKSTSHGHVEGNPTTDLLQEIIEMLASDISAEISNESSSPSKKKLSRSSGSFMNLSHADLAGKGGEGDADSRTLPLVLKSLHSTELSPPLRKVIAKLLPFLTYGQVSQSRELASFFLKYIDVASLGPEGEDGGSALMNTFVEAAINLPPVNVCDNLRKELIQNGFVEKVRRFLMKDVPSDPPSWSPALYPKVVPSNKRSAGGKTSTVKGDIGVDKESNREEWRRYFDRPGLSEAFKVLTGLCSNHMEMQMLLSDISSEGEGLPILPEEEEDNDAINLITLCHWMETTSDNTAFEIKNPNGILAETLLDALKDNNDLTSDKIGAVRKKTRDRKKELAEERRNRALVGMSAFGIAASNAASATAAPADSRDEPETNRSMFASMFSSLLAAPSSSQQQPSRITRSSAASASGGSNAYESATKAQPAWMAEFEGMEDEAGVTCAVCQEGRTLQPAELLGLYAYVKKVTIPVNQGGGKGDIDGTVMLLSLPKNSPPSLITSDTGILFEQARSTANALEGSSHALSAMSAGNSIGGSGSSSGNSRSNYYITTVSAGNAIHCSCHKKAKTADRNHPKAPKGEWEGASLRNSRVTCNVILPLISKQTDKVPLVALETALSDYSSIVTNTLGVRPKSILWSSLHDIRFLLLRMAHGEALNADCGGGSSSSNFLLMLYQLNSADMFASNAEHDESLEISRHARGLSSAFLVAVDVADGPEFARHEPRSRRLERGLADCAPMAALCSILFHNADDGKPSSHARGMTHDLSDTPSPARGGGKIATPPATRQWEVHKSKFLVGLIRCAGRRHALGLTDSGCVTSRGISAGRKNVEKARSFTTWSSSDDDGPDAVESLVGVARAKSSSGGKATMIDEYSAALRPMLTLYAVFDQLSKEFVVGDDDGMEESTERLAAKLESCHKAGDIHELLQIAEVDLAGDVICKYFEKGATSC